LRITMLNILMCYFAIFIFYKHNEIDSIELKNLFMIKNKK